MLLRWKKIWAIKKLSNFKRLNHCLKIKLTPIFKSHIFNGRRMLKIDEELSSQRHDFPLFKHYVDIFMPWRLNCKKDSSRTWFLHFRISKRKRDRGSSFTMSDLNVNWKRMVENARKIIVIWILKAIAEYEMSFFFFCTLH